MGRILRIGVDTVTNYSFLETSAYDASDPAATTGPWSDSISMDQDFGMVNPTGVDAEGVLVTFERFPDAFLGAMVKVKPTYTGSDTPALELWTHDSEADEWTRRRHIDFTNVFIGAPSGTLKVMDMTFFPFLRHVDKVWITLVPSGSSSLTFYSIQLFGQCEQALRQDSSNPTGDPCANPNDQLYTGLDDQGRPCPGTTFGPPSTSLPSVDVCNHTSVENYRDALREIPGALDEFDAWYEANAQTIALLCSGIDANPPHTPTLPPMPVPPLPPLPALDLCSQDSIDAFRAALAGDTDVLAEFDAFIDQLTSDGFFDLNCATPEPDEQYLDPNTLEPADEPDTDNNTPFGSGPGGQPQFPRPADRNPSFGSQRPPQFATTIDRHIFFFYDAIDLQDFIDNRVAGEDAVIQTAWADPAKQVFIYGNHAGPYSGSYTPGDGYTMAALDRIMLTLHGLSGDDLVDVLVWSASSSLGALGPVTNPSFRVWSVSASGFGSVTQSEIVDWLIERTNALDAIPDSTPENGGNNASESQRKSVVPEDATVTPVLTLITAYDPNAHLVSPFISTSDEAVHNTGGGTTAHKHLGTGLDTSGPPGTNPFTQVQVRQFQNYIKVSVTKKIPALLQNGGVSSVFVEVAHTTVTS